MSVVIRCWGTFVPHHAAGQYLKALDIEAHDGVGETWWTPHIGEALVFPDSAAAFAEWNAVPKCKPIREDGRPNKPLTAFSIMLEPAP